MIIADPLIKIIGTVGPTDNIMTFEEKLNRQWTAPLTRPALIAGVNEPRVSGSWLLQNLEKLKTGGFKHSFFIFAVGAPISVDGQNRINVTDYKILAAFNVRTTQPIVLQHQMPISLDFYF